MLMNFSFLMKVAWGWSWSGWNEIKVKRNSHNQVCVHFPTLEKFKYLPFPTVCTASPSTRNYSNCYSIIYRECFQVYLKRAESDWCVSKGWEGELTSLPTPQSVISHFILSLVAMLSQVSCTILQWWISFLVVRQRSFDVQSSMLENSYLQDLDSTMTSFVSPSRWSREFSDEIYHSGLDKWQQKIFMLSKLWESDHKHLRWKISRFHAMTRWIVRVWTENSLSP